MNPRTLSARLGGLEAEGIVTRTVRSQFPPHTEYSLTDKGRDLLPILEAMVVWGTKYDSSPRPPAPRPPAVDVRANRG